MHPYYPDHSGYVDSKYGGELFKQFMENKQKTLATHSQEEILEDSPMARSMKDVKVQRDWLSGDHQLNQFYCTVALLTEYSGKQPRSRTDFCFNCYGFRFRVPQQKNQVLNHYESIPTTWIFDPQAKGFGTFEYFHTQWQRFMEKFFDYFRECEYAFRPREGEDILFRLPFFLTCRYNHRKDSQDAFLSYYLQRDEPNPLASYPLYRGPLSRQAEESRKRKEIREQEAAEAAEKKPRNRGEKEPRPNDEVVPKGLICKPGWDPKKGHFITNVDTTQLYRAPHLHFPPRRHSQHYSSSSRGHPLNHPEYLAPPPHELSYRHRGMMEYQGPVMRGQMMPDPYRGMEPIERNPYTSSSYAPHSQNPRRMSLHDGRDEPYNDPEFKRALGAELYGHREMVTHPEDLGLGKREMLLAGQREQQSRRDSGVMMPLPHYGLMPRRAPAGHYHHPGELGPARPGMGGRGMLPGRLQARDDHNPLAELRAPSPDPPVPGDKSLERGSEDGPTEGTLRIAKTEEDSLERD